MRHLGFVDGQRVDLLVAMHHMPQAQAGAEFQIALLEGTFQQQDGAAPAQVAHALASARSSRAKPSAARRGIEHALNAVAVGIGFRPPPTRASPAAAGTRRGCGARHPGEQWLMGRGVGQSTENKETKQVPARHLPLQGKGRKPDARAITARTEETTSRRLLHKHSLLTPLAVTQTTNYQRKARLLHHHDGAVFSSLADNALFVAAIELLRTSRCSQSGNGQPWCPCLRCFMWCLAPFVGLLPMGPKAR